MEIKNLSLENFRNFEKAEFEFAPGMTLILGPNTTGKTTILEAIFLLSTTNSFRAMVVAQMIKYDQEIARISGVISNKKIGSQKTQKRTENTELEVVLTPGEVNRQKAPKRKFSINGVSKRRNNFVGKLLTVIFRPEDIKIITGSPAKRREFLDNVLVQINWEYGRSLGTYQKVLKSRNKILEGIRNGVSKKSDLYFWNKSLTKNGEIVFRARSEFIDFVNQLWPAGLRLSYQQSRFLFEKNIEKEIILGMTLTGPHRDEFIVEKQKRDLSLFGSRSEQRLAVLNLKLAELEFIQKNLSAGRQGEQPVLLLDDVFSELDEEFREKVLGIINRQQTIMTTAEPELIKKEFLDEMKVINL